MGQSGGYFSRIYDLEICLKRQTCRKLTANKFVEHQDVLVPIKAELGVKLFDNCLITKGLKILLISREPLN